jgi:putative NADH-flavin reductase
MRITVLGATGGTGRYLVTRALERGHQVDAIVRDPGRAALPADPRLTIHQGDVHDAAFVAAAIAPGSVVVSGLGVRSKKEAGTLTAGAQAVVAARPARIVWLGAEYHDKVAADAAVLEADAGRRFFPHRTPRATIARLMLDEAEAHGRPGQIVVPQAK